MIPFFACSLACTSVRKVSQKYFMIRVLCLSFSHRFVSAGVRKCVCVFVWILPMDSIKLKDQTELFFAWAERIECMDALGVCKSKYVQCYMDCLFKVKLANCENPQIKGTRYTALPPITWMPNESSSIQFYSNIHKQTAVSIEHISFPHSILAGFLQD